MLQNSRCKAKVPGKKRWVSRVFINCGAPTFTSRSTDVFFFFNSLLSEMRCF